MHPIKTVFTEVKKNGYQKLTVHSIKREVGDVALILTSRGAPVGTE